MIFKKAKAIDAVKVIEFIRDLALHEGRPETATVTEANLKNLLFGDERLADAYLGYLDDRAVAFAIVAERFSSFRGTRKLYIEDMLIHADRRGAGLGKKLFTFLAQEAISRGCVGLEWSALDNNDVAIGFYTYLNASQEHGVLHYSMTGEQLEKLIGDVA